MANIPRLRTVLKHDTMRSAWTQPLAIIYWPYTTNHNKVPYHYYKLVTKVISRVKISVLSYPWHITALIYVSLWPKPPS